MLVKIPHPAMGQWQVNLRGEAGDTVDVTMVYNASMSVLLESGARAILKGGRHDPV